MMFPSGPNGESLPAYRTNFAAVAVCDADKALAFKPTAERFLAPASMQMVEAWIAELDVITIRREGDEVTQTVRLRAYANRLVEYPADIARYALLVKVWKFFPAWEELKKVCDLELAKRKAMVAALDAPVKDRPRDELQRRVDKASGRSNPAYDRYVAQYNALKASEEREREKKHAVVNSKEEFLAKYGMTEEEFSGLKDNPKSGTS